MPFVTVIEYSESGVFPHLSHFNLKVIDELRSFEITPPVIVIIALIVLILINDLMFYSII